MFLQGEKFKKVKERGLPALTTIVDFASSAASWANATPFATWADYLGLKLAE